MRAERAVGSRGGAGDRNLGGGGGGGRGHPGRPHEHKRTHECAFARGSTAAISWRESLSFHLRAHAMCAMEGWEHNARWAECRMGCENRSAQPLHLHPPHQHRAATKPRRALLVLNLPSFRSMEPTTPSAGNHDGDALATTPPLDLGDPTLSQWTKGALPSETTR